MNALGIRCSNKDFSYVVMSGTKAAPAVVLCSSLPYPKNYIRPRSLHWLAQEVESLIKKHSIELIVMKRFEGRTKSGSFEERAEYERAVYVAAGRLGVNKVFKKMKSTLAKDLGLKGRAHYLETGLRTDLIIGYSDYTEKEQEAIICGWSGLE